MIHRINERSCSDSRHLDRGTRCHHYECRSDPVDCATPTNRETLWIVGLTAKPFGPFPRGKRVGFEDLDEYDV